MDSSQLILSQNLVLYIPTRELTLNFCIEPPPHNLKLAKHFFLSNVFDWLVNNKSIYLIHLRFGKKTKTDRIRIGKIVKALVTRYVLLRMKKIVASIEKNSAIWQVFFWMIFAKTDIFWQFVWILCCNLIACPSGPTIHIVSVKFWLCPK